MPCRSFSWIVAAVLFGLALAALSHIINSGIDPVPTEGRSACPRTDSPFYTTDPVSTATCTLGGGGERVELETFSFNLDISVNGPTYHGIGVTPEDLPAGTYRLVCTDVSPDSRLGTGPRIDVTAIATRAVWGFVLPPVLGIVGVVVLIVVVVRRHTSKARIRSMQAYAGAGSGYGAALEPAVRARAVRLGAVRVGAVDLGQLRVAAPPPPPPPPRS